MTKTALIIGLSSQDGSYLADLLLDKGYRVAGTIRRGTAIRRENMAHLAGRVAVETADVLDEHSLLGLMCKHHPDEVYNLAAQSVPADSWSQPYYTAEVTALGIVRVLDCVRCASPDSRVFHATSREIFGNVAGVANEATPIDANNPYGIAKAYAHMMVRCYRESYGLFACSGILFNHESPRRGLHFVTRKITAAVACLGNCRAEVPLDELGRPLLDDRRKLHVGWLDAARDWGYAPEYVEAMWGMLQHDRPRDYVIATNTSHTVREFCQAAFSHAGLDWQEHVVSDAELLRPTEIRELRGDYALAARDLGWQPRTTFGGIARLMVDADLRRFT